MRLLLFGKTNYVGHLVEDAADDLRRAGHVVRVFAYRASSLAKCLEPLLTAPSLGVPLAALLLRAARRFRPDLVVVFGPFHGLPRAVLAPLAALPGRPPMVAWIGDRFGAEADSAARLFDAVAYTDSGFLDLHRDLALTPACLFVPLAATRGATASRARPRQDRPVFVASATAGRLALLASLKERVALVGPDWRNQPRLAQHGVVGRRAGGAALAGIYASHAAALNIRHELNVINGLNQRHFAPYMAGTPVLSDAQRDLEACFDIGQDILVYRDAAQLDELIARVRREPAWARAVAEAGRRRVLAEHTYAHRVAAMARSVGLNPGSA